MAVVLAVQRWRSYLLGQKFVVKTYQRALKYLLEQRVIQPQHQKWLSKLLGYNFEVVYRLGVDNKDADALSRVQPVEFTHMTVPTIVDVKVVKEEVEECDPKLQSVIQQLLVDSESVPSFSLH